MSLPVFFGLASTCIWTMLQLIQQLLQVFSRKMIESLSTKQVIIRITAIIAVAELLIMLTLHSAAFKISPYLEAVLDVVLLALLSAPLIYLWVIKPFVNARDHAIEQIRHLAYIDPLTQLANRRNLLTHLERVSASCIRHKIYGALLLIDLDGFKLVNDEHGHDAGDAVLVEIARRLNASIRSEDVASRLGGDEFVILVDHLDTDKKLAHDKVLLIADKIIELANLPIEFMDASIQIGASIGICLLGFEHQSGEATLRKADISMYRAKKTGKGRVAFAD